MIMGTYTVQEFLQYYMRDVVGSFNLFGMTVAENAESAVSFFIIALLIGAIASSLTAGILSDRVGRKKMVYAASALQAIVPFILIFFHSFWVVVALGIVFGLGYGAYGSVDWAHGERCAAVGGRSCQGYGHLACGRYASASHQRADRGSAARSVSDAWASSKAGRLSAIR